MKTTNKNKGGFRNIFSSHSISQDNSISKSSTHSVSSSSSPYSSPPPSCPSTPIHTFSESMMEENIDNAEILITKWNLETNTGFAAASSLFYDDHRKEAKDFISCVKDLQRAMRFFILPDNSNSVLLIRSQNLMETAMKRLQKEFYQILSTNRDRLDPESISGHGSEKSRCSTSSYDEEVDQSSDEDEIQRVSNSINEVEQVGTVAMNDLKMISDCMISSGYGKEIVRIYKIIRKSIVDESLYKLGVERLTPTQINKMDWEMLDFKIKNWVYAVKIAVKTLFLGERILCDYVFSSETSRESCFTAITKDSALELFQFTELVAKGKKSPEKMFRILDLYDAISELWPEIESIFSYKSMSNVRTQAVSSLLKLGEAVRAMLTDFEAAIQKDSSKALAPGGGIHPLTRYVMNYVCFLSDYTVILSDIVANWPLPEHTSLPESYLDSSLDAEDDSTFTMVARFAWLVLVLLCKLDGKAALYKNVPLSYLFLANNLNYVVSKVRGSNLRFLLGEEWISRRELTVKQYTINYERMGWSKVLSSLPTNPTASISLEATKECLSSFNTAFETVYRTQSSWVVTDSKLRDEIKVSICKKVVPVYREFYDTNRAALSRERNVEALVRYSPDDLMNYLSDLFYGMKVSGSGTSTANSSRHFSSSH
ncbi:hypothetical protein C5167_000258 [Papaver somniferum]|uniref:Exocyst subunit Exo70 family protein n=1 Tax=Papaver somniferum TaxID=3469 RepID=A0A4Y7KVH6_PAPSO|nr:exocyst complex component EXO70H1-like [Papaver somniferum]RZC76178.1 hypothetical protein C5167_000258 [Papaver somniferum]